MFKRIALLTTATLTLSAPLACAAEIKLGGGGASIATIFAPVKAAFEKATGHNLIILQSTPVNGLKNLWAGKLDASVTAVGLDGMIAGVAKSGVNVDKSALTAMETGTNKTVVFVHPSNKVGALSKEQMKGLFTGKITNWKDVGGNDEPVLVVWGKNSPGQNALFTKVILDGEKVTAENLETSDYKGIKDSVASNTGAIGIDPLGMTDATVKAIKPSPEANSAILLITKGAPPVPVKQLLDFIKTEGKKYIKE
jgi:phosphate transport system substrate-binding protein